MLITVIDNYDSFVYNLVRYLREIEGVKVCVMRNDEIHEETIRSSDAILLSPGPGIPSEAGQLLQVIKNYHKTKPMLGVCLGHQAIGEFFGVKLQRASNIIHGKATIVKKTAPTTLFEGIETCFNVGRYHSWILESSLPDELQITSLTDENEVMSIKHCHLPIEGVQFHPESILTPEGRKMIVNWVSGIRAKRGDLTVPSD